MDPRVKPEDDTEKCYEAYKKLEPPGIPPVGSIDFSSSTYQLYGE